MWLLAQVRQPGRQLYSDLTDRTWVDLLEELISDKMFLLEREGTGVQWLQTKLSHSRPVWTVFSHQRLRVESWSQLLTIASAAPEEYKDDTYVRRVKSPRWSGGSNFTALLAFFSTLRHSYPRNHRSSK